jgi:hypothetical protein
MPRRLALIVAALVAALFLPPAAEASPWIGVWIEGTGTGTGTCVSAPDNSVGAFITREPCLDTGNQLWNFEDVAKFTYRITRGGTGLCLAAPTATAGAQVQQLLCGGPGQEWRLTGSGNTFRIGNTNGGGCLARKDTGGSEVVLGTCVSSSAEWQLLF